MASRGWACAAALWVLSSAGCGAVDESHRRTLSADIEDLLGQPIEETIEAEWGALRHFDELEALYRERAFEPVWIRESGLSRQGQAALDALRRAPEQGLGSEDYLVGILSPGIYPADVAFVNDADRSRIDVTLSLATMEYIKDLHEGRISTRALAPGRDVVHDHKDPAVELRSLSTAEDASAALEAFAPRYPQYASLKSSLSRYRSLAETDSWRPLASEKTIHPGERYEDIDLLRRRLRLTGDLAEDATSQGPLYDAVLVEAVRRFQHRHSLNEDAVLGKNAFADLNTAWSARVSQIIASMERWRWVPEPSTATTLIANIPEYQLRAITPEGRVDFLSRIIVGQSYAHLRTPIFFGKLRYIDFRPFWNVPLSIIEREMSASLDEPGYLETNGYEIAASSALDAPALPVTADTIAKVRSGALTLRQKPGPGNALGLVKFIFPNDHRVFLHSTPARSLFRKEARAFSHGCLRVEKAAELAEWVLGDQDVWDREAIRKAMASGPTTRVLLERDIPVYILYLTAFVEPEVDDLHFGHDIYGLDAELARALGL